MRRRYKPVVMSDKDVTLDIKAEDSWRAKGLWYIVNADERAYKTGFKDGYNKAKKDADKMKSRFLKLCNLKDIRIKELEEANEWHDLRKDPDDLPKDDKQYLVLYFYNYKGKKETSYGVRDNLHSDFKNNRGYTEQIIAWKEIKEKEKEDSLLRQKLEE